MVQIYPYNPEHKKALLRILELNIPRYFAPAEYHDFKNYLEEHMERYYVVFYNEEIVGGGGVNFNHHKTQARLSWGFLHPDYHGITLGTRLLKHRIEVAKSVTTVQKIIVRTSQFTYKFFEKNGFKVVEITKDYWAKGYDLYNMEYVE